MAAGSGQRAAVRQVDVKSERCSGSARTVGERRTWVGSAGITSIKGATGQVSRRGHAYGLEGSPLACNHEAAVSGGGMAWRRAAGCWLLAIVAHLRLTLHRPVDHFCTAWGKPVIVRARDSIVGFRPFRLGLARLLWQGGWRMEDVPSACPTSLILWLCLASLHTHHSIVHASKSVAMDVALSHAAVNTSISCSPENHKHKSQVPLTQSPSPQPSGQVRAAKCDMKLADPSHSPPHTCSRGVVICRLLLSPSIPSFSCCCVFVLRREAGGAL